MLTNRPCENLRSKSAFSTNSDHYQYNSLPVTISTNSSVTAVPCAKDPRKIQFIYGKSTEPVDVNNVQCAGESVPTQQCNRTCYSSSGEGEIYPAFPNVKTSFSTEISDALFNINRCNCHCSCSCNNKNAYSANHNRYVLKKQCSDDSYENYNIRTDKSQLNK